MKRNSQLGRCLKVVTLANPDYLWKRSNLAPSLFPTRDEQRCHDSGSFWFPLLPEVLMYRLVRFLGV
jgi:hypothetical protein